MHKLNKTKDLGDMSQLDRAKQEAERVAHQLKADAQRIQNSVSSQLKKGMEGSSNGSLFHYPNLIYQFRSAHLVALTLQALSLYLWSQQLGLSGFLLPFVLISINLYLVGRRWTYSIDGRFDFQQLLNVSDHQLRVQYGIAVFGTLLLAVLTHFLSPDLSGGVTTLIYNLSNYFSVALAVGTLVVDIYAGIQS